MIELKKYVYNLLTGDSTLQGLVTNIYPSGVDAIESYPAVTIETSSSKTSTYPTKLRIVDLKLSIWSNNNMEEVENIYQRMWELLNYVQANTPMSDKIFWSLETNATDSIDNDRRIWSKHFFVKFWVTGD